MRTAATLEKVPREVWRLAGVIVFGAFVSMLDASVVNVGLGGRVHSGVGPVRAGAERRFG